MKKYATRHKCTSVIEAINEYFEKQIIKLKEMIRKLKRIIEKIKDTIEENI